jgi:hypothetical protein
MLEFDNKRKKMPKRCGVSSVIYKALKGMQDILPPDIYSGRR